ncbi:MAG: hypothetical protein Q8M77_05155 [Hydrogenophaga sp.]|nr:hypothetical protein [Hydrogenophaga sp.]
MAGSVRHGTEPLWSRSSSHFNEVRDGFQALRSNLPSAGHRTGEVKFRASPSVTEDAIYQIEIVATRADLEITQAVSIALQDLSGTPATIDLGTYGQLILPVVVEGKTYYVWDRNADGLHNDSAVHGIYDHATHDVLDEIFKYDSRGVPEEGHNAVGYVGETDNTFRYAALNGLRVALPTYGGEMVGPYASSPIVWQSDTAVDNGGVHNPVYDDLLAIWDAHSISMPPYVFGIPPGWQPDYWSATPWYEGHTAVLMFGLTTVEAGDSSHYVALQVL